MKERLAAFLLPPLLLLGFLLREVPFAGRDGGSEGAPAAVSFLDPETAWHARRVSLALSAERLPQSDRFLSHPHATAVAEPPLFDAVLAWTARLILGRPAAAERGAAPDEKRVEAILAQAGPALSVLLLLATWAAARRGDSKRASGAGLVALLALALAPLAVSSGAAGRLSLEHWALFLFAVQAGFCRSAWTAAGALDRLQSALLAGLATGVGLASTPLFAAPAIAAWAGFLLSTYGASDEDARDRARAGLLFSMSAMLPAQLPLMEGPWQPAPPGPVAEWTRLAASFWIVGGAAFALPFIRLAQRWRRPAVARALALAAALALVLVTWIPETPTGFARPLRASLGMLAVPTSDGVELALTTKGPWLAELAPWLALAALALSSTRRASVSAERTYLVLAGSLALLAAAVHQPAALLALLPAALAADAWLCGAWSVGSSRLRRVGLAGLALGAAWSATRLCFELRADEARDERLELVRALRWLREHSDPSGAWNSAGAAHQWGVLCDGSTAPLVAYHARRPALGTSARACGDPPGVAKALAALAAEDPRALVERAAALGARYLVLHRDGDLGPAARALAEPSSPVPSGAERVYPIPAAGDERAHAVTIYRLERARRTDDLQRRDADARLQRASR